MTNEKKQTKKTTMTKKEYLQGMYSVLGKKFPLFKTMNTLVEKGNLSNGLINNLTNMMQNSIKNIQEKVNTAKLQAGLQLNAKIKNLNSNEDLSTFDHQINAL